MIVKRKYEQSDYQKVIAFLREEYLKNKDESCWLAQRWEDMEYRVNTLYCEERGGQSWHDYIMLWFDEEKLVSVCNNEGGRECFMHIAKGYEFLYPEMLDWAEKNISINPFRWEGQGELSVFALASQSYREEELKKRGYKKEEGCSYFKKFSCNQMQEYNLPEGFSVIVGTEGENHVEISRACELGFHPEMEGEEYDKNLLTPSWNMREKAPMFDYKYEVVVKEDATGEYAAYSYVWVDKVTKTGYIEPVSTRSKYRGLGLGKVVQIATLNMLCKENIEYCFVNPYCSGRDKFYSSAGYKTFDLEYVWKKFF